MHIACGTLSYRQAPLERALEGIRRAGFQAVELGCVCGYCEHIRPEAMDRADVKRLSDLLRQHGLEVISLAGHVDLQYPLLGKGPEAADQGFELLRRRADLAQELGVPIVNSGLGVAEAGEGHVEFDGLVRSFRRLGFSGPYSLEIEFLGPDSTDPTPEIIDEGVARSYRFMRDLGLENG